MKNIFEIFQEVILRLEQAQIPYMVVGSVASIIYGEPRMTRDMDLVLDILSEDSLRLHDLFPLSDFYCPPQEVLNAEIAARGQFNLIHHDSGLKVDIIIRKATEHARTEFQRRVRIPFWGDFEAFVASPEDVIIKKLAFYREGGSEKHLSDIRGILSQTEVDHGYLETWIRALSLEKTWSHVSS